MNPQRPRSTIRVLVVTALTLGVVTAGTHQPDARAAEPATPPPEARSSGLGICGKTMLKGRARTKPEMRSRIDTAIKWINRADTASDVATGLSMIFGPLSAGAVGVKLLIKVGKEQLVKHLRKMADDVARKALRRHRRVRLELKVKCKWGIAPYPALGVRGVA